MNKVAYKELAAEAQVALDKREFVSWAFENASSLIELLRRADKWKQDSVDLNSILLATLLSEGFKPDETGTVLAEDTDDAVQLAIRKIKANLYDLAIQTVAINEANGWKSPVEDTTDHRVAVLALIAREAFEAIEEIRDRREPDEVYYVGQVLGVAEEDGLGTVVEHVVQKPEGVPIELADVIIRTLDFCQSRGIDIVAAIQMKLEYNKTRAFRHGNKLL